MSSLKLLIIGLVLGVVCSCTPGQPVGRELGPPAAHRPNSSSGFPRRLPDNFVIPFPYRIFADNTIDDGNSSQRRILLEIVNISADDAGVAMHKLMLQKGYKPLGNNNAPKASFSSPRYLVTVTRSTYSPPRHDVQGTMHIVWQQRD